MAKKPGGRRVMSYVGIAVGCALVFLIPSTWVIARGHSTWLAAIAGALAFPVLPGGWHAIAEWRRRKRAAAAAAKPAKVAVKPAAGLSGGDRFKLRLIAVALIVITPLVVLDRKHVWAGLRHHAGWFIPTGGDDAGATGTLPAFASALLPRVPAEAELVIVSRGAPQEIFAPAAPGGATSAGTLFALGDSSALVIAAHDTPVRGQLDRINARLAGLTFGPRPYEPMAEVADPSSFLAVSPAWRDHHGGPGAELRRELARAPADAMVIAAMVPRTSADRLSTRAGAGWIVATKAGLHIEGRLEALDAARAEKLATDLRAIVAAETAAAPAACSDSVGKIAAAIHIDRADTIVTVRADLARELIGGLVLCAMTQ